METFAEVVRIGFANTLVVVDKLIKSIKEGVEVVNLHLVDGVLELSQILAELIALQQAGCEVFLSLLGSSLQFFHLLLDKGTPLLGKNVLGLGNQRDQLIVVIDGDAGLEVSQTDNLLGSYAVIDAASIGSSIDSGLHLSLDGNGHGIHLQRVGSRASTLEVHLVSLSQSCIGFHVAEEVEGGIVEADKRCRRALFGAEAELQRAVNHLCSHVELHSVSSGEAVGSLRVVGSDSLLHVVGKHVDTFHIIFRGDVPCLVFGSTMALNSSDGKCAEHIGSIGQVGHNLCNGVFADGVTHAVSLACPDFKAVVGKAPVAHRAGGDAFGVVGDFPNTSVDIVVGCEGNFPTLKTLFSVSIPDFVGNILAVGKCQRRECHRKQGKQ